MSVSIRLAKIGKKNAPSYKIVAANTRDKRNGRFLDVLGYYNPSKSPEEFKLEDKKFTEWVKKGALVSDAVAKLKEGTYTFVKYSPKAQKAAEKAKTEKTGESAADIETQLSKPETTETPEILKAIETAENAQNAAVDEKQAQKPENPENAE